MDQALKQWLTRRKRAEGGNTKIWISRERKKLFRWNKKSFIGFEGLIWWKIKSFKKIADTSFKETKKTGFTFAIELRTKFIWSHGLCALTSDKIDLIHYPESLSFFLFREQSFRGVMQKMFLINFAKFTGKHMCRIFLWILWNC